MKIRTDFVTNSSSSSYCVSYEVKTKDNKEFILDMGESYTNDSTCIYIRYNNTENIVEMIKECSSVDELKNLLLSRICIDSLFEYQISELGKYPVSNEMLFDMLDELIERGEAEEYDLEESWVEEAKGKYFGFANKFDSMNSLEDVKSITIKKEYSGWGECARESVDDFLKDAISEELNWDDKKSVHAVLSDRFTKSEIDSMICQIHTDYISNFTGWIKTTIDLKTKEVTKEYIFDSF